MNPILLSLLLAVDPTPKEVMTRLANFVRSAHSLSADLVVSVSNSKDVGAARMVYVRPDKLCYTVKWRNIDYRFVGNPHGCWDANYESKVYDENTDWHFWYPASAISSGPSAIMPGFLMDATLHSDRIGGVKYVGSSVINGVKVDEVEGETMAGKVQLFIDGQGQPLRYVRVFTKSNVSIQADLKNIVVNAHEPDSLFSNNPPLGFAEYSTPVEQYPLKIGASFPTSGWSAKHGASLADLFKQKPTLVVVTEENCEPSARSAPALNHLVSSGGLNIAVATLSKSGAAPEALRQFPTVYDASGSLYDQLNVPGTPLFFLVGTDGKVWKEWYGYDPDQGPAFEKDVLDSVKTGASS